jgi:hypothetical protein
MAEDKKKADKDEKEASVAGRAWNATKEDGDPDWATMPNKELKGKLEFAVDRVRATGIAQTNFEIKAKELLAEDQKAAKDEGPMAVSAPQTALGGTAPLSTPVEEAKPAAKPAPKRRPSRPVRRPPRRQTRAGTFRPPRREQQLQPRRRKLRYVRNDPNMTGVAIA